jgi:hypothetical protein
MDTNCHYEQVENLKLIHSQEETAAPHAHTQLLAIGAVEITTDNSFVSRSRLEPKKDGDNGYRLVVD